MSLQSTTEIYSEKDMAAHTTQQNEALHINGKYRWMRDYGDTDLVAYAAEIEMVWNHCPF